MPTTFRRYGMNPFGEPIQLKAEQPECRIFTVEPETVPWVLVSAVVRKPSAFDASFIQAALDALRLRIQRRIAHASLFHGVPLPLTTAAGLLHRHLHPATA